jgi:hypothetical protein
MATIGSTSAPSTNTVYYDALLTTTMDTFVKSGTMFDQIFKDNKWLALLRQKGCVIKQNGGERIRVPLMYGNNSTIGAKSAYGLIDTTPQDGMTTAFYEWRELAGSISISRKEERQNSGEAQLLDLLEKKIMQAKMTMSEELNRQLLQGTVSGTTFVPGTAAMDATAYELNPLGYFLSKDNTSNPASGGNVGNLSRSETWWRHRTAVADSGSADTGNSFALAVTTYAGMETAFKRLNNYCGRGSGGYPDMGVTDQVTYETYENSLGTKIRYTDTKMADMGFDTIKIQGATLIWDEVVPDIDSGTTAITKGTLFLLNSKFYHLVIDSQTDIVTTPFIEPENQTAKTAKILFMGNSAVSNIRKHGVLYATSQSIVA